MDLDHEQYARECAIDIPGPETERLGGLARHVGHLHHGPGEGPSREFPGCFFNVGFVIDPAGEVILRHHKLVRSCPSSTL